MRINQYLSTEGICSRREADALIVRGEVLVNGTPAVLGQQVTPADIVTLKHTPEHHYYRYYKPEGEEATVSKRLTSPLTLDKHAAGLMLLTDDGRVVHALTKEGYVAPATYLIETDTPLTDSLIGRLGKLAGGSERVDEYTARVTVEHPVHLRQLCADRGYHSIGLMRTELLGLTLQGLKEGEQKPLTAAERTSLLTRLSLT